jgi:hypothetical protein
VLVSVRRMLKVWPTFDRHSRPAPTGPEGQSAAKFLVFQWLKAAGVRAILADHDFANQGLCPIASARRR